MRPTQSGRRHWMDRIPETSTEELMTFSQYLDVAAEGMAGQVEGMNLIRQYAHNPAATKKSVPFARKLFTSLRNGVVGGHAFYIMENYQLNVLDGAANDYRPHGERLKNPVKYLETFVAQILEYFSWSYLYRHITDRGWEDELARVIKHLLVIDTVGCLTDFLVASNVRNVGTRFDTQTGEKCVLIDGFLPEPSQLLQIPLQDSADDWSVFRRFLGAKHTRAIDERFTRFAGEPDPKTPREKFSTQWERVNDILTSLVQVA